MIICNGYPKSGTTLLLRAALLLGLESTGLALTGFVPNKSASFRMHVGDYLNYDVKRVDAPLSNLDVYNNSYFAQGHVIGLTNTYAKLGEEGHKVINIRRNPRNALISLCKWVQKTRRGRKLYAGIDDTEQGIINAINGAAPWVKHTPYPGQLLFFYKSWEQWQNEYPDQYLSLYYEDLVFQEETLQNLARWLGNSNNVSNAFKTLVGGEKSGLQSADGKYLKHESTFSGDPSDWRKYWTPRIDEVWKSNKGEECEAYLNYSGNNFRSE